MLAFGLRAYSSKVRIWVYLEYITTYRQEEKGFLSCTCEYGHEPLANLKVALTSLGPSMGHPTALHQGLPAS
jgi:hypothetical protein